jgi:hypothetical protein
MKAACLTSMIRKVQISFSNSTISIAKKARWINKPKIISPTVIDPTSKVNHKIMMNTSDNLKNQEDESIHKNGTVAGSDHKQFSKYTKAKTLSKDDTPYDHSKSVPPEDEKHDAASNIPDTQNEIIYKERKGCLKCPESVIIFINRVLQNTPYIIFMTIVTLFALFADDIRLLCSPKSGDEVFWSLTVVALFLFGLEL